MSELLQLRPRPPIIDRRRLLLRHPLFGALGTQIIDHLVATSVIKAVARNTSLFRTGDPGSALFGICAGEIKICVPTAAGESAIFAILRSGEVFGEIAVLDGKARTADAVALTDCELFVIERRNFMPLLMAHPEIGLKIMNVLCERLRRTSEQVQDVMFLDLPARLARALLHLIRDEHAVAPASLLPHTIRITQHELGQMIGMSRESVNKQMRCWEAESAVRLVRGGFSVTDVRHLELAAYG